MRSKRPTWAYSEMKFNTTLESWVYPTDDAQSEYSIFTKHVGYSNGGYAFTLKKVGDTLRATFNMQADNNGNTQDGRAGIRGAYSSTAVPLKEWSHVAVTFDTSGPDGDPNDLSVGRIRIYVDGEDVTTSDASGNNMQPGTGETSIFAYSENSPWNDEVGYNGTWCAGEFSVGGFYGWQNAFIGRLDEAKVWNITKDAAYFSPMDTASPPRIDEVKGIIGGDQLQVTFSEGVYANIGATGNLEAADFALTDTDDGRTVISVSHTADSATATLTLSSALDGSDDIDVDTLAAAASAIYDEYGSASVSPGVTITMLSAGTVSEALFELNEPAGSTYTLDQNQVLFGSVSDPAESFTGDEQYLHGDGVDNYILFTNGTTSLQASRTMTLEARVKPTGIGVDNYVKRVLARDNGGANYQMSVWRNPSWENYNPPDNVASIAFWVKMVDSHDGNSWKPVLTDYTNFPIVSDHWYQIRIVWNSDKASGIPGDIYVDDQGTDGLDTGENWAGYANATDSTQSQLTSEQYMVTGDEIAISNGNFAIGCNVNNNANNVFAGEIDWVSWKSNADYTGVSE